MCITWLNWSLKFHIKLRTISLLISTHNTQVYVQWKPYLFVWLYLIKCVFTCSIFVDSNTKIFLSVLGIFGKYFVFTKTEKFQKQCCLVLVTQLRVIQVTCYSRELKGWFWRLVYEWKVQSWGVHSDFHGSTRNSLAGRPSIRKKHLEIFFIILTLSVLVACPGDLFQSRKTRVLCFKDSFLKLFQFFPWTFYDYSLFLSIETHPNTSCHSLQIHFCTFSPPNLQEKGMGSHFLTSYLVFWASFSWIFVLLFCFSLWVCFDFWDCPCLDCWGIVLMQTFFDW